MTRTRRPIRAAISLALATSLATGFGATLVPRAAHAASGSVALGSAGALLMQQHTAAPASVLGLEGEDGEASKNLTDALRKAFAVRGYGGGEEISLVELRLTFGCENDEPSCLSEGGQALSVDRLVFGYLRPTGDGNYQLELQILDVGGAIIEKQTSTPVKGTDLEPDRIDATATEIVNSLFPEETDSEVIPTPTPLGEEGDPGESTDPGETVKDEPRRSKIKFGLEDNPPRWKKVGLGISIGVAAVGLTAALAFGIPVLRSKNKRGRLYEELVTAAETSLTDNKDLNDVDPTLMENGQAIDLCATARAEPDPVAQPGSVRNGEMTEICDRGDTYEKIANAGWAVFGVGAASTLVFTGLLFVHREKPAAAAMLRHGLTIGATPVRGGAAVGSSFRF